MKTDADPEVLVRELVTSRGGQVAPLVVRYALLTLMDPATVTVSATSVHEVHGVSTWRSVWLGGSAVAHVTASKAAPGWQGARDEGAETADTITAWRQPLRSLRGLTVDRVSAVGSDGWAFSAVASFADGHQVVLPLGLGTAVHDDGDGEESLLVALREALT